MLYFKLPNEQYTKIERFGKLQITDSGRMEVQDGWMYKRRFLEHSLLLYMMKGEMYLTIGERETALQVGQMMVLYPFFTMVGTKPSSGPVDFFWLDFHTDQKDVSSGLSEPVSVENSHLRPLANLLCDTVGRPDSRNLQESLLLSVFQATGIYHQPQTAETELISAVRVYLDEHRSELLTVDGIANALHYHKDYLGRAFVRQTGQTLKEYINRQKLDTARMLLRTSIFTVAEIGAMLGYTDSNLFTKFFQYHEGISPGQYRRSVR